MTNLEAMQMVWALAVLQQEKAATAGLSGDGQAKILEALFRVEQMIQDVTDKNPVVYAKEVMIDAGVFPAANTTLSGVEHELKKKGCGATRPFIAAVMKDVMYEPDLTALRGHYRSKLVQRTADLILEGLEKGELT
jgi:hypothetical protein